MIIAKIKKGFALSVARSTQRHNLKGQKDGCLKDSFMAPLLKEADDTRIPMVVCRIDIFKNFIETVPVKMRKKLYKIIEPADAV